MPVNAAISPGILFSFLVVLSRVAGTLVFIPLPGFKSSPQPVRVLMAVCISISLYPVWPVLEPRDIGLGRIVGYILADAAFGIAVGLSISMMTEIFSVAAQLAGLQAGFSYASTIDPSTDADSGVLIVFSQLFAGLLFFSLGFDREIVRVFARSLESYPPGTYAAGAPALKGMIELGSAMFSTGLRLALPIIGLLLIVDIALALMGRIHSQMQLLTLAFPLKMLLALAVLGATLSVYVPVLRGAAERTFTRIVGMADGR